MSQIRTETASGSASLAVRDEAGVAEATERLRRTREWELPEAEAAHLEFYRNKLSGVLNGCDCVEVRVDVPGEDGIGKSVETIFVRSVIAPAGTAERVVEAVTEVCRLFDRARADDRVREVFVSEKSRDQMMEHVMTQIKALFARSGVRVERHRREILEALPRSLSGTPDGFLLGLHHGLSGEWGPRRRGCRSGARTGRRPAPTAKQRK
jgi:hypothetical protein